MRIFIDIDNTICISTSLEYVDATPIQDRIHKANEWYDEGHTIVYWTARGTKTGLNWFEITYTQLKRWGCKFHELRMGKPEYDVFIDDKNWNSECDWNKLLMCRNIINDSS